MAKRKRIYRKRRTFRRGRRSFKRRRFTRKTRKASWYPFGSMRKARLVYVDNVTIDVPSTGLYTFHSFRVNSIYDPDSTGFGHQPYGHDELAKLYKRYRVTGSKITVTAMPGAGNSNFAMGIKQTNSSVIATSPLILQEQPGFRYRLFGNGTQTPTPRITSKWSLKKYAGRAMMDDIYAADFGVTPADSPVFAVGLFSPTATDVLPMVINVRIEYAVRCWEPLELGVS